MIPSRSQNVSGWESESGQSVTFTGTGWDMTKFLSIFGWESIPSQSVYSRFFGKYSQRPNNGIFPDLQHWYFDQLNVGSLSADFDSTITTHDGDSRAVSKETNPNKKAGTPTIPWRLLWSRSVWWPMPDLAPGTPSHAAAVGNLVRRHLKGNWKTRKSDRYVQTVGSITETDVIPGRTGSQLHRGSQDVSKREKRSLVNQWLGNTCQGDRAERDGLGSWKRQIQKVVRGQKTGRHQTGCWRKNALRSWIRWSADIFRIIFWKVSYSRSAGIIFVRINQVLNQNFSGFLTILTTHFNHNPFLWATSKSWLLTSKS